MHRLTLRLDSPALGRPLRVCLLCPPGRGPFRSLYLLHGLGADADIWRQYDVEDLAARHRLLVAMPDGDASYYVNDPRPAGLGAWEDAIVRDVRGAVDRAFRTSARREARGIAGISMGGYGALRLALRHPGVFGAAGCLSGSLYFGHAPHPEGRRFQMELAAGLPAGEGDVFALARRLAGRLTARPALWLACGIDDTHIGTHRDFHRLLDELRWPHAYAEGPGGHARAYWRERMPPLMDFMGRALRANAGTSADGEEDNDPGTTDG